MNEFVSSILIFNVAICRPLCLNAISPTVVPPILTFSVIHLSVLMSVDKAASRIFLSPSLNC